MQDPSRISTIKTAPPSYAEAVAASSVPIAGQQMPEQHVPGHYIPGHHIPPPYGPESQISSYPQSIPGYQNNFYTNTGTQPSYNPAYVLPESHPQQPPSIASAQPQCVVHTQRVLIPARRPRERCTTLMQHCCNVKCIFMIIFIIVMSYIIRLIIVRWH